MSVEPSERSSPDPDVVAAKSFTRARRGYEVDEVRAFLVGLGSQLREARQQRDDLERRLVELERRAADPKELDEDQVTQLLGEETARVLDTARKAAAEIRTRAETEVAEAREEADRHARAIREAADQYAAGVRSSADEGIARRRSEADEYAEQVRGAADSETATQRGEADAYAAEIRSAAEAEATELRAQATGDAERMRSEAESVLADRTAEAETAAQAIRSDAETAATRVREDADRYAEATRAAADAHRTDAQGAADKVKAEAIAEADRVRADARAIAEELVTEAESAAEARRVESERAANQALSAARDKGRSMVEEARGYRERIIADLAARRRSAQDHLDALAAARDALSVALTDVTNRTTDAQRILGEVVIPASEVGDMSVDRAALSGDDTVAELDDPAEETAPEADEEVGAAGAESNTKDAEAGDADRGEVDPADPDEESAPEIAPEIADDSQDEASADPDDGAGEAGSDSTVARATGPTDDDRPATGGRGSSAEDPPAPEVDGSGRDGSEAADDVAEVVTTAPEASERGDAPAGGDRVDALFASLRAENAGDGDPAEGSETIGTDTTDSAGGTEPEASAARDGSEAAGEEPGSGGTTAPGGSTAAAADVATAEDTTVEVTGDDTEGTDPDVDLLDRRDAATDEVERQLARRLKRVLSDEQNETLDLLRRTKGTPTAGDVLPAVDDHLERYRAAALDDLTEAERAGASFFGSAPSRKADVYDVAGEFATDIQRQIRGRLERAFDDGGDEQEIGERIRSCYREWKTQRIAEAARHYVLVAFSRGVAEAAADGSASRWLVDDGDLACPDCDDNALAGGVTKGDPFPTGDLCPPAHPGCRCLAVPVT